MLYGTQGVTGAAAAARMTQGAAALAPEKFSAVYARVQAEHAAARVVAPEDARTNMAYYMHMLDAMAAQQREAAAPFPYAAVYAPGSDVDFAPRNVDFEDPAAELQKLEDLRADIREKGLSGFFDRMGDDERYSYLYERYADAFGADFMDSEWKYSALMRVPNESDLARNNIRFGFHYDLSCAFAGSEDWNWKNIDSGFPLGERIREAFCNYFGYGDMTKEERYAAIVADYSRSGGSYAATFKLFWLLEETGVADPMLMFEAHGMLSAKMGAEYAALDMTVADMAKSRYANANYGFDADAEILEMVDYMHAIREHALSLDPSLTDVGPYSDPEMFSFMEKLAADLKALSFDGLGQPT